MGRHERRWNRLVDVLLVLSDEAEMFVQSLEFERRDEISPSIWNLSELRSRCTKSSFTSVALSRFPTVYKTSSLTASQKGQSLPATSEHEDFKTVPSALCLSSNGFCDANCRACATYVCSPTEQSRDFDIASFRAVAGEEMICAKMRVGDVWLLAATSTTRDRYAPEASRSQNNVAGNTNRIGTCRTPRREERGGHCHNSKM